MNNNNNHHNFYPTFKDKFGSRLISQLIGLNTFQSKLLRVNVDNINNSSARSIQNSGVTRFYWRTKCFPFPRAATATATESNIPSSSSSFSSGHVYFLDVTVDFIAKSTESQAPRIETKFGTLIKRSNDNNNITKSSNDCDNNSGCSYYIQTDAFAKEDLDKYAQDLRIDLNETGPMEMADIMSKSLHNYNNSLSTSTEQHHYKKKCDIPPCMKLYSVQIIPTRNDNGHQISSSADCSSSRIYNNEGPHDNVDYKDRIGIYHMDFLEQGFIHFPYQNQSRQMKSFIGQTAFEMMISNIHGCDQNDTSSSSRNCSTKDNDDKTSEEILQTWWSHQQLQVDQVIDKEKIVAEDTKNCNQEEPTTNNYNEDNQKINDITEKDAAASSTVIIHNSASNDFNTNKKRRIVHVSNNKGQAMFCTGIQTKKKLKKGKMKIGIMK